MQEFGWSGVVTKRFTPGRGGAWSSRAPFQVDDGTAGTGATGGGGMGGIGGVGGTGGAGTNALFTTVWERDWLLPDDSLSDAAGRSPLDGVRVCELDTDNCVSTDAHGRALLNLPADQEVAVSLEKAGYLPIIFAYVTTDEAFVGSQDGDGLPNDDIALIVQKHLGSEFPLQGGVLSLTSGIGNITAGLTFEVVDNSAQPFYFDATTRRYTYELEATTQGPLQYDLPFGQGGFLGLSPGTHEIVFGGAEDCGASPRRSWPGSVPNSIRLPVRDGHLTFGVCRF